MLEESSSQLLALWKWPDPDDALWKMWVTLLGAGVEKECLTIRQLYKTLINIVDHF